MNLDNYKYRKITIDVSEHAKDRALERELLLQDENLLYSHYKSFIDRIINDGKRKIRQDYLAYSKNLERGFVYSYDGSNVAKLVTVLPKKPFIETYPKEHTKKLKVESIVNEIDENIKNYIHDIFDIDELKVDGEYEEVILTIDDNEYTSHFIDGVIYDIEDLEMIDTE